MTQQENTAAVEAMVSIERWRAGLDALLGRCSQHFRRIESRLRAKSLVEAMMAHATRRNCWTLAEAAGEPNPYRFQHLLSRAKWDEVAVRTEVRSAVWEGLSPGTGVKVLVVDETGDVKKGEATVGVQRQYSGTAGKIENCQLAVFLALACEQGHAAIDTRLYLPRSWAEDTCRRAKAGVPESVRFQTKPELAWEMIADALGSGCTVDFVAADEAYGVDTAFRTRLESWSQSYVLAVARTTPVNAHLGGRKLTAEEAITLVAPQHWEQRSAGDGAKGRRYFHWAWIDLQSPTAGGHASLLARRNNATGEIAYYLAWTGHPVSVTDLIEVAGMRWRVEEYFQGSKELAALDEHQVRTWTSWHRWVTLAMLAFAFLALTRAAETPPRDIWDPCSADEVPLTCNEIRHLLTCAIAPRLTWAHRIRWSSWRRRHQAVAKRLHYARQLALAA